MGWGEHMELKKKLFCTAITFVAASFAFFDVLSAQESAITDGVSWLVAYQDTSGLWGAEKKIPFRDATVVVDVLSRLNGACII